MEHNYGIKQGFGVEYYIHHLFPVHNICSSFRINDQRHCSQFWIQRSKQASKQNEHKMTYSHEVFTVISTNTMIFWVVMLYSLVTYVSSKPASYILKAHDPNSAPYMIPSHQTTCHHIQKAVTLLLIYMCINHRFQYKWRFCVTNADASLPRTNCCPDDNVHCHRK
jgi:hypothetical protein